MSFTGATTKLLLATLVPLLGSCVKKDKPVDYGPEFSVQEVQTHLSAALHKTSPFAMQPGELVHTTTRNRFHTAAGPQEQLSKEENYSVVERNDGDETVRFRFLRDLIEYKSPAAVSYRFEDEIIFRKTASASELNLKTFDLSDVKEFDASSTAASNPSTNTTYHNLQESKERVAPPDAVKNRTGCSGIPECTIEVSTLMFDQVLHYADESKKRYRYKILVSGDVPYNAATLSKCVTYPGQVGTTFLLVEQCSEVVDFRFGQAAP
jgi:hypothetical protein